MKKLSKPVKVVLIGLLALLVVVVGGSTAYAAHFADKALPSVYISGKSVTGMDLAQLESSITDRAYDVRVTLKLGDESETYALPALGVTVDAKATAEAALSANPDLGQRFKALFNERHVPVTVQIDDKKLQSMADRMIKDDKKAAKDAEVKYSEEHKVFEVTPSSKGMQIDPAELRAGVQKAAEQLTDATLDLKVTDLDPAIDDAKATELADQANKYLNLDISVKGLSGKVYAANTGDKAGWLTIDTKEGAVKVNDDAVRNWVKAQADANYQSPVNGSRLVRGDGSVITVISEGRDGFKVSNLEAVSNDVVKAVHDQTNYAGTFSFEEAKRGYDDTVKNNLAPGAEKLVYPADVGEKWLDLNLSGNYVVAYEGATPVSGKMYIVPGAPGMETPTGTYKIYLKYASQTMRGTNPDGSRYVSPGVQWVSYFTGSIAFHAAPWQSHFGWSGPGGSHGCVNMTVGESKFVYEWAPIGTVVVSHY